MSTVQRLQWLIQEIHNGRNCFVAFSYNGVTRREKIKFTLEASCIHKGIYRPCLMGALMSAQCAVNSSISTDKGHKHSAGHTVVEFWLQQPFHSPGSLNESAFEADQGQGPGTPDSHGIADPTIAASSSLDIGVEGNSANSSLDGGMAENVAPPCKRVRFSLQDEVSFVDADTLAPQSLVEFIADVPSTSQSLVEFIADVPSISLAAAATELEASILKAYTFLRENSCELQNCVAASQLSCPEINIMI